MFALRYGLALVSCCLSALWSVVLAAQGAIAEFAIGNVVAMDANGRSTAVVRGTGLEERQAIETNEGRVQIRFVDGAYVSLQPQTRFRIDAYRYTDQGGGTDRILLSLLKGRFRTVTGLASKRNRVVYRLDTVIATIGIRGTEYALQLDQSLYGHVTEGSIEVCSAAGCLSIDSGQAFTVPAAGQRPRYTDRRALLPPAAPMSRAQATHGDSVRGTEQRAVPTVAVESASQAEAPGWLTSSFTSLGSVLGLGIAGDGLTVTIDQLPLVESLRDPHHLQEPRHSTGSRSDPRSGTVRLHEQDAWRDGER